MKKTSLLFMVLFGVVLLFSSVASMSTAFAEDGDPVAGTASTLQIFAEPASEEDLGEDEDEGLGISATSSSAITGNLGNVFLITGSEIEIEFDEEVLDDADAHATFTISVDGKLVDWEYLSYFDFGPYAERGGVVNVRLDEPLDIGQIRARCRESGVNAEYQRTEDIEGPKAAASIEVDLVGGDSPVTAEWHSFYLERSQGYMSRFWTYASREAGTLESVLGRDGGSTTNFRTNEYKLTLADADDPKYTDEYIARMVGEGTNKFLGRAEYLSLPMIYTGYTAFIVGPSQSVYEAPEYRELYVYGETDDTYTRRMIKATYDGNFDPETGEYEKPYIVGTSDDVMRHNSPIDEDGVLTSDSGKEPARPRSDHFYFAEAFFDIAYELAVVQGSQDYPLTEFNKPDDYRFDLQLEEAYEKAEAAGKWQGTRLMDSVKDYYIFGNMAFQEFIPETQNFERESFPVNTRQEVYEYDYPLYWALSGIHGKWCMWAGKGAGQTSSGSSDSSKVNDPWWWRNQPDNYTYANAITGSEGKAYEPLQIVKAEIAAANELHIYFNREVSTIDAVMNAANWQIYIDGVPVTTSVVTNRGYLWRGIRLSTSGDNSRLDNGNPYGQAFKGFTQADKDERSIAVGGWIADNEPVSATALEKGQYVGLEEAIRDWGAGAAGTVTVSYVGAGPQVKAWDNSEMVKDQKFEAIFKPWVGIAYRSPLGGVYIYMDTAVAENGYYMYERSGDQQPTAKDVAMAAGHQYDSICTNNSTVTYPTSAGGADFDKAFAIGSGTHPGASPAYSWNNGTLSFSNQTITNGPVTYDRPGLRLADGFTKGGGGMKIAAGSVLGHHAGEQPNSSSMGGSDVGENLRIEGWGGNTFQTEDVGVLRDFNLSRYRNESLVFHEGGHGIDSSLPRYEQQVYNDISAAYATATAPANGIRYFSVDGVRIYVGARGEYVSTGNTFYNSTMREQFEGKIDTTWSPVSNRIKYYQYDPYGMEAFKRLEFNGDLNLWYDNKVGDPAYRVIPEDWELLRDLGQTDPAYAFAKDWTSENDLVAWGLGVPIIARDNPYTGWHNPLIKWTSYSNPSIWRNDPYKEPTRDDWRKDIRFDPVGNTPYYPNPDGSQSFKNQEHPFFYGEGIPMPERPAETQVLVNPVLGTIVNDTLTMPSPVLVQFKFADYGYGENEINMNNAMTSFELFVDDELTHFYFYDFKEADGQATVTLRLDWPLEEGAKVEVNAVQLVSATPKASVEKINSNENNLTINVTELYSNGVKVVFTATATINNNAEGTYEVGDYLVYVNTKGNTQIRDCYIVVD